MSGACSIQRGKRKMAQMTKSVRMRGMNLLHFVLMVAVMTIVWLTMYSPSIEPQTAQITTTAVLLCYLVLSVFLYQTYNAYKIGMYRAGETFYSLTLANLIGNALTYLFACLIQRRLLNCVPELLVLAAQTAISGLWCLAANQIYFKLYKPMKTLVIYKDEEDLEKLNEIVFFENRFDVIGKLRDPDDVFEILPKLQGCQAAIVSGIDATLRNGIVKACIDQNVTCYFIPHIGDVIIAGAKHVQSFSIPIMETSRAVLSPEYAFIKRAMDIVCSALALVVLSPFMLATAIVIKAYDHGPVLYKQVRLTKDGKRYSILKFRSMRVDAEKDGVARLASDHDDRITPVGRLIRAIRFDELPQLINILKGDMSIVGPRPERKVIADEYCKDIPEFDYRLKVRGGLTGYAQIYGKYNTSAYDKLRLDLMYIENYSLLLDIKLMILTIRILFSKESTEGVDKAAENQKLADELLKELDQDT